MNREIKFRAYDKEDEEMRYFDDENYLYHYPFILRLEQVFKKDSNYDDYEDFEYKDVTDKIELMQYTGLHDKNGKEIYEEDVVKITNKNSKVIPIKPLIAQIVWSEEYLAYILITTSVKDAFENLGDYIDYDIEVIGNVFENPELLGGEYAREM